MTALVYIVLFCLAGGILSVVSAALFALNVQRAYVPMLISYAVGALLGAVFLEILPHAIEEAPSIEGLTATILLGILLFFTLEKLVLWRHCHGDHCEAHAMHDEAHCPENKVMEYSHAKHHVDKKPALTFKPAAYTPPSLVKHQDDHDHGRSGLMIIIGDTFHNFVDGVLIAAAFVVDIQVGMVAALAIIAHEIPQEVGDFLILLHSGYSKKQALLFNLLSSLATVVGGLLAYFALQTVQSWVPYILGLATASMLYVAVADLIPGLHKRTAIKDTLMQISLIFLGVASIAITKWWLEG